jgi:hypothetical protein
MGDVPVFDRRFQHHALVELADHRALDLLPGSLTLGDLEPAGGFKLRPALRQLLFRDQDVGGAFRQVYADAVAGLQYASPPMAAASERRSGSRATRRCPTGGRRRCRARR